jgi:glutathione S-transferase
MALIVYGAPVSPFVRKVRVVLAEKGLEYSLEPLAPFPPSAQLLAVSPLGKIPAFRDTDLPEPNTLADSTVICDYIEHKYPTPPLYPAAPYDRARALWFEEYADSFVAGNLVRGLFFERIVKKMLKMQTDESVCEKALSEHMPAVCAYLEKELGGNEYLVGNAFSIADISVGSMFVNIEHAGAEACSAKVDGYIKRLHARPSFRAVIDEETPMVQHFRAA